MSNESSPSWLARELTRRETLRGAVVGGLALGGGSVLAACGSGKTSGSQSATTGATGTPEKGGTLRVGVTGGGTKDTIDAHLPTSDPDIARVFSLYEPLAIHDNDYKLQMLLAESIEPSGKKADVWTVRLKPDLLFHNGKPVTPEDVIFSFNRIIDPKAPKVGAVLLSDIDTAQFKKLDARTLRVKLKRANADWPDFVGEYVNGIVPVGYTPQKPVGTGAFKYQSFNPGQQSVFTKFDHYWQPGLPHLDQLTLIDFPDDTARVNALLGGQVDAISNLPAAQTAQVKGSSQQHVLESTTGGWQPFTMRVDQAPFSDPRVRQAFRLIVDRNQMIEQALSGHGRVANDLYAPFDPAYASNLPQRHQDLEQAKSLLKQAGHSGLTVRLVTAPVFQGIVEAAQVFAQQASGAGVKVNVQKVDSAAFFGTNYLKWTFAQDFWITRNYLPQVSQGGLPASPFNETHWADPTFQKLIQQARATLDPHSRTQLLGEAQKIEYDSGGYIIPYFSNQIDAYSSKLTGFVPSKTGVPLSSYNLKAVGFTA